MRLKPFTLILLIVSGVVLIGAIAFSSYAYSFLEYVISDDVRLEFEQRLALAIHGRAEIGSITCDLHGVIKLLDVELDPTAETSKEPKVILKIREIAIPWRWPDILASNRLTISTLLVKQANLIIVTRDPRPGYSDSSALAPNLSPLGSIGSDGAIEPPGSSFGWLLKPSRITLTESRITLQDFKGKTWGQLSNINGKLGEAGSGLSLTCVAEELSVLNSRFTLKNVRFPLSIDSMNSCEVKNWTADSPFGPLSGTVQVQGKSPVVSIHGSGDSYNKFVGLLGFAPATIDEQPAGPLSFDSQWKGLESGHIIGVGTLKLSESHFTEIPTILHVLSQLSPKIDPVSGTTSFAAEVDIVGPFLAQATLSNFQIVIGLPGYTEKKIVSTPGRHHTVIETKTESPSPQVLATSGAANIDLFHSLFTGNFSTPVSASVAGQLTTITKAKPPIKDKWLVQLTTQGTMDTLALTTVAPPAPPSVTPTPVPRSKPTTPSPPHHKRH